MRSAIAAVQKCLDSTPVPARIPSNRRHELTIVVQRCAMARRLGYDVKLSAYTRALMRLENDEQQR